MIATARPLGTNSDDTINMETGLFKKLEATNISQSRTSQFEFFSYFHFLKNHPRSTFVINGEKRAMFIPPSPLHQVQSGKSDKEEQYETDIPDTEFKRLLRSEQTKLMGTKADFDNKRFKSTETTLEAQKRQN